MSFKLVDNKGSSDNKLHRRRRADDILLDVIPSTEYIVNRSGKYCCKVCPHWPVFDTPAMLKTHRETGKHRKNGEEWERANLERTLNESTNEHKYSHFSAADSKGLIDTMQLNGASEQKNTKEPCTRMPNAHTLDCVNAKSAKRKRWTPFFQTRYETAFNQEKVEKPSCLSADAIVDQTEKRKQKDINNEVVNGLNSSKRKKLKPDEALANTKAMNATQEQTSNKTGNASMKMRYYAKMKKNGWVLDSEGKWVKDEECEFDSDEEPPTFSEFERWDK